MKRLFAACGTALILLTAPAAVGAQTTPRQEQLSLELARAMFNSATLEGMMGAAAPALVRATSDVSWWSADWTPLMQEAFREEIRQDLPKLQVVLGRAMTQGMTEAEIEAGLALMQTRGGMAISAAISVGAARPKLTAAEQVEMDRIAKSPDGRSFMRKLRARRDMPDEAKVGLIREILPGAMRRFGEKAEALQGR